MSTPGNPDTTNPLPRVAPQDKSMEELVALCKRRGFVYPASEIYGGINGFWDYGPLGTLLKNNIRDWWWKNLVECPPIGPDGEPVQIVGLDSSIIQNPKAWVASGHVGGFSDPMVDDTETKQRFRADHLYGLFTKSSLDKSEADVVDEINSGVDQWTPDDPWNYPALTCIASGAEEAIGAFRSMLAILEKKQKKTWGDISRSNQNGDVLCYRFTNHDGDHQMVGVVRPVPEEMLKKASHNVPSPFPGDKKDFERKNVLTEPREFNLMFDTTVGAIRSDENKAYLRPETAQGIFLNYKNVVDTMRVKMPFGIAQVGKSFRNEVTPRNFIFRSREFEQMEMEWFCPPDEAKYWLDYWKDRRMEWWLSMGIDPDNLLFRDHDQDELSHYAKDGYGTVDVEYKYPFTAPGFGELEGIAHRCDFDLSAHQEHSGTKMEYFDQARQLKAKEEGRSKEEINAVSKYIPHVIEPASGLTRAVLVLLCEAFTPTPDRKGSKYILSFKPRFAPIKAGIFPLVNKDGMPEVAQKLYMQLRDKFTCEYDAKQSIGKRYARMDEIGTPTCVTIDGDTLTDQTVTVRDRDTLAQERIGLGQVERYLADKQAE